MASDFPRSPRVLKGALVVFDSPTPGPPPRIIVFQYNPESLSRTLSLRAAPPDPGSIGDSRQESHKVMGPPLESITVSVMLDAADQLENPANNPDVVTKGLHPALAALEMLLYPTTAQILRNKMLASAGAVQICAAELPLTLLVWGVSRIVPVRLTSFSVTEEAYDPQLNPIRAKVDLGLQVLTFMELKESNLGYGIYLAYQTQKEILARIQQFTSGLQAIRGILPL
jgi:hypothetical protein